MAKFKEHSLHAATRLCWEEKEQFSFYCPSVETRGKMTEILGNFRIFINKVDISHHKEGAYFCSCCTVMLLSKIRSLLTGRTGGMGDLISNTVFIIDSGSLLTTV